MCSGGIRAAPAGRASLKRKLNVAQAFGCVTYNYRRSVILGSVNTVTINTYERLKLH